MVEKKEKKSGKRLHKKHFSLRTTEKGAFFHTIFQQISVKRWQICGLFAIQSMRNTIIWTLCDIGLHYGPLLFD